MTWHVEQAQDPPHAPVKDVSEVRIVSGSKVHTLHLNIVGLGNVQEVVSLCDYEGLLIAVLVYEGNV